MDKLQNISTNSHDINQNSDKNKALIYIYECSNYKL